MTCHRSFSPSLPCALSSRIVHGCMRSNSGGNNLSWEWNVCVCVCVCAMHRLCTKSIGEGTVMLRMWQKEQIESLMMRSFQIHPTFFEIRLKGWKQTEKQTSSSCCYYSSTCFHRSFFLRRCQEPLRGEKLLSNRIGHYSTSRFVCPETNLEHVYVCIVC